MDSPKVTPMMKQYLSIKEKYTDAILFYRMGDFYEMFFEDARKASPILEIALTARNKKDKNPVPMCGIPVRAVDAYIGKLITNGHKVAICEQIEDAATAKGLVKRDVVRVITPGMIIDNELLDEKSNNYILSVIRSNGIAGLSYLDISTGTFRLAESDQINSIIDEAKRISPSEVIFPESAKTNSEYSSLINLFSEKSITFLENNAFNLSNSKQRLIEQFKTRSLEGFGCEKAHSGVCAAGALVFYVNETQKQGIEHLTALETYSLSHHLVIDDLSCRNLELITNLRTGTRQGTFLEIIDNTVTAMGARLLKQWVRYPLLDKDAISERHDAVEEAKNNKHIRTQIRQKLKSVYDLERLSSRIAMGRANARDLVALKNSLYTLPAIFSELETLDSSLLNFSSNINSLHELADLIDTSIREDAPLTINDGGIIKPGFNLELDELIKISRDGKGWLARLETEEKEKTGITTLKVKFNKVFGYYIEVSKSNASKVPPNYVRKQTLVNAERYITDELKTFESKVLNAQDQRASIEYKIFNDIRNEIIKNNKHIIDVAGFIANLDCLFNLAEIAEQNNYSRPDITSDGSIIITDGRHPVVEKLITGERYVPNSIHMDNTENQIIVITGPNMAGKSTILRQVALFTLMAQMGSFIPAESAVIAITDRIFTRVGALDNLASGQSTFMVEMEETANILNHATSDSLVIMDEIGRGTSTFDGLSIAWAVAEFLHDLKDAGVKTLFATHYHELTELAKSKTRVKNFNIAVKEWNDEIIFLRKLLEGGTNRSYGIQVARLAGIPDPIIKRAKSILLKIENREQNLSESLVQSDNDISADTKQVQLSLFRKPEEIILEGLRSLDISTMTPLDAINYLSQLKEKANNVCN